MPISHDKIAVVLFQLGGPDSLEAIEPFLFNLFCDPDIVDFPGAFLARKPLAKFISARRSKRAIGNYRAIGGKSPILDLTNSQAASLEHELNKTISARVFVAMRYWHPLTESVLLDIKDKTFRKIILLPLYPQYSKATTGSSFNEWRRLLLLHRLDIPSASILSFHDHPLYIDAIVEKINLALKDFSNIDQSEIDLVFSAHGTPVSLVRKGDPYKKQIEETVRLVMQAGKWRSPDLLCYQSKVGPVKWLEPSLKQTIRALAEKKRRHLLIIPVSFVTDHIETLHEINIEIRKEAGMLGFKSFNLMPALNDSPIFMKCLSELVLSNI